MFYNEKKGNQSPPRDERVGYCEKYLTVNVLDNVLHALGTVRVVLDVGRVGHVDVKDNVLRLVKRVLGPEGGVGDYSMLANQSVVRQEEEISNLRPLLLGSSELKKLTHMRDMTLTRS